MASKQQEVLPRAVDPTPPQTPPTSTTSPSSSTSHQVLALKEPKLNSSSTSSLNSIHTKPPPFFSRSSSDSRSSSRMGNMRWSFRKLSSKQGKPISWPWLRIFSSKNNGFRWKKLNFKFSFLDELVYAILSVIEAVVTVGSFGFFVCFCGGRL